MYNSSDWPKWNLANINKDHKNVIESEYKIERLLHEANLLSGESPIGEDSVVESGSESNYLFDIGCKK